MAFHHFLKNGPGYTWLLLGFGASFCHVYPHTLGLKKFVETNSCNSQKVDTDILLMAEMNKKDLGWDRLGDLSGTKLKFFSSSTLDFLNHGSLATKWGGVIGVPVFFGDKSVKAADENPSILLSYGIDISTEKGREIFETFRLSQNAQRFILAREMTEAKSTQIYLSAFIKGISFPSIYALSINVSRILKFQGAILLSFVVCIPVVLLGSRRILDVFNCFLQSRSDAKVASISEEIAQGGVEFYDRLIQRTTIVEDATESSRLGKKLKNDNSIISFFTTSTKASLSPVERQRLLCDAIQSLYGNTVVISVNEQITEDNGMEYK